MPGGEVHQLHDLPTSDPVQLAFGLAAYTEQALFRMVARGELDPARALEFLSIELHRPSGQRAPVNRVVFGPKFQVPPPSNADEESSDRLSQEEMEALTAPAEEYSDRLDDPDVIAQITDKLRSRGEVSRRMEQILADPVELRILLKLLAAVELSFTHVDILVAER